MRTGRRGTGSPAARLGAADHRSSTGHDTCRIFSTRRDRTPSPVVDPDPDPSAVPTLGPDDAGRPLSLVDLANAAELQDDDFRDDTFQVGAESIAGIGGEVQACGEDDPVILDLRTYQRFSKINFDLGIDGSLTPTDSTTQTLVAQILGNGDEVLATGRAELAAQTQVSADIGDVVAVKIRLYLDESTCEYDNSVVGVVSNLEVS